MARKRIAILLSQLDELTQKRFTTEFMKEAYIYDYDICVFAAYQKYQETMLKDIGDSNIFNLVNYDLFDAIVIMIDTILTPNLSEPLQQGIKEKFNGPVIVIDQESEYFESVMMDHYSPVKKIVDHLFEEHNFQKIAFLGGKEGHVHSVQRYNAFLDSMKEHGALVREKWIFHGNYWFDSAEEFADKLLEDRNDMPEAIVCANDYMAIGLAARLSENGIRIPEDIAITGYDTVSDGQHSPAPLTSALIPADKCGKYTMRLIRSKVENKEMEDFVSETPLFIGASCGCPYQIEMAPKELRTQWRTQESSKSMFSDFNQILDSLLSQNNLKDFLKETMNYVYQIKPYNSFDICLNDGFLKSESFIGEKGLRSGYTDDIYRVLHCDINDPEVGRISFEDRLKASALIPELEDERDYPTTFIFNPLFFNDRCFGYTVLNYGSEVRVYNQDFRIWMRNIMQGLEAFYRQTYMMDLVNRIKADQIRDGMTGLYNYEGFIKNSGFLIEGQTEDKQINIITIDIKGLKAINEIYGRNTGKKAIRVVARSIQNSIEEDDLCCRMGNDEFIIAIFDDKDSSRGKEIINVISNEISSYKIVERTDYPLQIHTGNLLGNPKDSGELELQVNRAVSIKNHTKNIPSPEVDVMEEIRQNQLVMKILNDNLLTYYYQPIVSAVDGSIFAYEALMRYEQENISPVQIIKSATYLNRLNDVEKATLLNVTKDVENNIDLFGEAKVFINSLPGETLSNEDDKVFTERMEKHRHRFVIEFTEESELSDLQLERIKKKYSSIGNQIAIDDYGAGYSNVNNLIRYTPHYVKIDRMLIENIRNNVQKQHMVKSIIDYAHKNDINALAEGVETKDELQECIRLGVDLIQGYYTGRPSRVPVTEINQTVRSEIERFYLISSWGL